MRRHDLRQATASSGTCEQATASPCTCDRTEVASRPMPPAVQPLPAPSALAPPSSVRHRGIPRVASRKASDPASASRRWRGGVLEGRQFARDRPRRSRSTPASRRTNACGREYTARRRRQLSGIRYRGLRKRISYVFADPDFLIGNPSLEARAAADRALVDWLAGAVAGEKCRERRYAVPNRGARIFHLETEGLSGWKSVGQLVAG
jgi:hypothetical protein